MTAAPDDRLARRRRRVGAGYAIAAATTLVTACAHSLAGGAAPSWLLVVAALTLTALLCAPVAGHRGSLARQIASVAIAQLVQHGIYSMPSGTSVETGHVHDVAAMQQTGTALGAATMHSHGDMTLAHVAAGLISLVVLRFGASIVASLARIAGRRLDRMRLRLPLVPARRAPARPAHRILVAPLCVLRDALARRGPPLVIA